MDVVDETAVTDVVERAQAKFGPIKALVNSAGISALIPALETSMDQFRRILEVNLLGTFLVSREVAIRMKASGGGAIVNIASISGIRGSKDRSAYGASKAGVINLTKVMAVELAPFDIRVNAIAPGPIETPLIQQVPRDDYYRRVPQRRYGQPEEVAQAIAFLVDKGQSGYITGQTLSVDGGFTAAGII
jgi:NAD(P)-dependent dehydrogenase (short-subunit alcohol dehydrogenase family)